MSKGRRLVAFFDFLLRFSNRAEWRRYSQISHFTKIHYTQIWYYDMYCKIVSSKKQQPALVNSTATISGLEMSLFFGCLVHIFWYIAVADGVRLQNWTYSTQRTL